MSSWYSDTTISQAIEPMEKWEERKKPETQIDRKTGRKVWTEPPYHDFEWKDGYVLRELTTEESKQSLPHGGAVLGGDPYEWVPKGDVDITL